ncbi:MAG: hypothetical protein PHR45_07765 [Muribaculaceae bacterium]|nr:hypothetical protein [Muribaculaceae bacterium]
MNNDEPKTNKKPSIAFITTVVITALTAVVWTPFALGNMQNPGESSDKWILIVCYPIFSLLSVYLAHCVYAERKYLSWILVILVWISLACEIILL